MRSFPRSFVGQGGLADPARRHTSIRTITKLNSLFFYLGLCSSCVQHSPPLCAVLPSSHRKQSCCCRPITDSAGIALVGVIIVVALVLTVMQVRHARQWALTSQFSRSHLCADTAIARASLTGCKACFRLPVPPRGCFTNREFELFSNSKVDGTD